MMADSTDGRRWTKADFIMFGTRELFDSSKDDAPFMPLLSEAMGRAKGNGVCFVRNSLFTSRLEVSALAAAILANVSMPAVFILKCYDFGFGVIE